MKKIVPAILGCALTFACFSPAFAETTLESHKDKVSYSIGLNMGMSLATLDDSIDIAKVIMGLQDGQAGTTPQLTEEEIQAVMTKFQAEMQAKQQTQAVMTAAINGEAAASFLATNKEKDGVVVLDSGLQYKIMTTGTGDSPQATDTVSVHYRGTLIGGKEFDSSHKRGEPAEFPVNRVIAGWTEALQLMKVGSKWELYIPAELAYADRGAGELIGPNTLLIFEVELLEIKAN